MGDLHGKLIALDELHLVALNLAHAGVVGERGAKVFAVAGDEHLRVEALRGLYGTQIRTVDHLGAVVGETTNGVGNGDHGDDHGVAGCDGLRHALHDARRNQRTCGVVHQHDIAVFVDVFQPRNHGFLAGVSALAEDQLDAKITQAALEALGVLRQANDDELLHPAGHQASRAPTNQRMPGQQPQRLWPAATDRRFAEPSAGTCRDDDSSYVH